MPKNEFKDCLNEVTAEIITGGGAYIGKDANVEGDFAGRDIYHITNYATNPSNWRTLRKQYLGLIQQEITKRRKALNCVVPITMDVQIQSELVNRGQSVENNSNLLALLAQEKSLLLVGEPGSGKTTTLIQMMDVLLTRARDRDDEPLPFYLSLARWSSHCEVLDVKDDALFRNWLSEELNLLYQVTNDVIEELIERRQLTLLIDGLDETHSSTRMTCVTALNQFHKKHGIDLIVCCRSDEYNQIKKDVKLNLATAVKLCPLTEAQIDEAFEREPQQLSILKTAFQADRTWYQLAASPLLFTLIALAYQDASESSLPKESSIETRREQVFTDFVNRILETRQARIGYTKAQTIRWLTWLAHQLRQREENNFLIEGLQPDCLQNGREEALYWLLDRLCIPMIGGVLSSLLVGVFSQDRQLGIIIGLIGFVITSAFEGDVRSRDKRNAHVDALSGHLTVGLPVGVVFFLLTNQVWEGTIIFFLSGIIGGLIGQLGGKPSWNLRRVHIVEDVEWSLFNALRAARIGVVGGVFLGLATIASFHFTGWEGLTAGSGLTLTSLLIVVIRWLLSSLVSGAVMTRERDLDEKSQPNEGIWLSLRHAFQALLIDGGAAALAFGVTASFIINQDPLLAGKNPFLVGLISFLLFGRVGFLLYGGYACLSHVALRFVLWYYGHMPWDYAKFLDSCVKSGFLQQIHNHYEFVHLLLLEYIATLDE